MTQMVRVLKTLQKTKDCVTKPSKVGMKCAKERLQISLHYIPTQSAISLKAPLSRDRTTWNGDLTSSSVTDSPFYDMSIYGRDTSRTTAHMTQKIPDHLPSLTAVCWMRSSCCVPAARLSILPVSTGSWWATSKSAWSSQLIKFCCDFLYWFHQCWVTSSNKLQH